MSQPPQPPPQPSATDIPEWDREPTTEGEWQGVPKERIAQLIMMQIPRYQQRPLIWDKADVKTKIESGLETELKGDFCWSLSFRPSFIAALLYEGFLPICTEMGKGSGLFVCLVSSLFH